MKPDLWSTRRRDAASCRGGLSATVQVCSDANRLNAQDLDVSLETSLGQSAADYVNQESTSLPKALHSAARGTRRLLHSTTSPPMPTISEADLISLFADDHSQPDCGGNQTDKDDNDQSDASHSVGAATARTLPPDRELPPLPPLTPLEPGNTTSLNPFADD